MGKKVVRLGDSSSHGGRMITATGKFKINGKVVCVDGDLHQCPIIGHGVTPVSSTSGNTKSGGKYIIRIGDSAGCGAIITSGSANTETD